MKTSYFFIWGSVLFIYCFPAAAQVMNLQTEICQSTYRFNLINEKIQPLNTDSKPVHLISAYEVKLQFGELVINYKLPPVKRAQDYYKVSLFTVFRNKSDDLPITFPAKKINGDIGVVNTDLSNTKSIVWTNLISCLPSSEGLLEIKFVVELFGEKVLPMGVRCDYPPVFGFKQQSPYYAAGIIGLGGLATSLFLKGKATKNYNDHLASNVLYERNQFYADYEKKLQNAEYIAYASLGLLAVDVFLFFRRQARFRKRSKVFQDNCNSTGFQIYPQFDINMHTAGIQSNIFLKYSF